MRTKRLLLFATLFLAVVAVLLWFLRPANEPTYHGKTMSAWIRENAQNTQTFLEWRTNKSRATRAEIDAQGKEGGDFVTLTHERSADILPYLIKSLKTPDNRLWKPYQRFQSRWRRFLPVWPQPQLVRRVAAETIGGMGSSAAPAVPALCDALLHDQDPIVRLEALNAINSIGPKSTASAVPALACAISNDSAVYIRQIALTMLPEMQVNPPDVAPALVATLRDPENAIRYWAALDLQRYAPQLHDPERSEAVKALRLALTNETSEPIRQTVRATLQPIDDPAPAISHVRPK